MGRFRLAAFWFLYLAGMGVFFPFASLYLRQRQGLSPSQIGIILAMVPLTGLLCQPLWSQLADRSGSRQRVLAVVSLGAGLGALGLSAVQGFGPLLVGVMLFAAFHTAVLPLAMSVTLAEVGTADFGRYRMWGTVGFLVFVTSFPTLDRALAGGVSGDAPALGTLFPVVALLAVAASLAALSLPPSQALSLRAGAGDTRRLMTHGPVIRLLIFVFLTHTLIQGPIYLFPLYLQSRGGDAQTLSRVWILMLLLEIPLVAFSGQTLRRFGARGLLRIGLVTEAVRWSVCALTTDLVWVCAVQILHGVGVAGILVGAPLYVERVSPPALRSTGQALVSMAGAGAGAILSTLLGGWLMEHRAIEAPYAMAGIGAAILALLVRRWLPEAPAEPPVGAVNSGSIAGPS